MIADEHVYQLFGEANPAPPDVVPTIDRPSADDLLQDARRPTLLTQIPRIKPVGPDRPPRRRGLSIALASFLVVVVALGVSLWIGSLSDDGGDAAGGTSTTTTTIEPTTTVGPTTSLPPTSVPPAPTNPPVGGPVEVPNLVGLSVGDAQAILGDLGLAIDFDGAADTGSIVTAQDPAPGEVVEAGASVIVDARTAPTCDPPVESEPRADQADINVVFACGGDGLTPGEYHALQRLVPWGSGQPIERIEWTLRSLLGGPNEEERSAGFTSFFDFATAEALNGVTLIDGHVVADFNEAIIVNNASTSAGSVLFNAELRANLFQYPEVDSIELRLNGSCEDWSRLFEGDGCWVITRADWDLQVADWYAQQDD